MKKCIKFPTPNGWYKIDLLYVAKNKACFYQKDKESEYWQDEVSFVLNHKNEGIEWLIDWMSFEDIKDVATKINSEIGVSESDFWESSDGFSIISEKESGGARKGAGRPRRDETVVLRMNVNEELLKSLSEHLTSTERNGKIKTFLMELLDAKHAMQHADKYDIGWWNE